MRRKDERFTRRVKRLEEVDDKFLARLVEARERFVRDERVRIERENGGKRDATLLAPGKRVRSALAKARYVQEFEAVVDAFKRFFFS